MSNFTMKFCYLFVFLFSVSLISCATITVNVYFPAEEVRQAYTNLEEEFLLEGEETIPDAANPPVGEPGSSIKNIYPDEPTITVKKVVPFKSALTLPCLEALL